MLKSAYFRNFKALREFSISLRQVNVLVGPNNSGKSTILDGFRALSGAIRVARRQKAVPLVGPDGHQIMGHLVPETQLPISTANIHTDYRETDASLVFRLETGEKLQLLFRPDRSCIFFFRDTHNVPITPSSFKRRFPIDIALVPTLGPFEEDEKWLTDEYVNRWAFTRRGHRMFRNFWRRQPDNVDAFREMVERTWPRDEH